MSHDEPSNTPPQPDQILTPAEVARLFAVDAKTVTRWAAAGKIRTFRTLGGHRRFYRSEVERALRQANQGGRADQRTMEPPETKGGKA